MGSKYPTPLVSQNEKYLDDKRERFDRPAPSVVVRLKQAPEKTVQLPRELALTLLRRRTATIVASLDVIPDLVINEDDVDELEASGFDLWKTTLPITQ